MECRNLVSFTLFVVIGICFIDSCAGLGYGPYYGGYGGFGGYGYAACPKCSPYAYSLMSPCLKAKILKKYIALKKPCLTPSPILHRPYAPCLPCLARQPNACYKSATCLKYPPCGPCPYANCGKCLKHKATLALCS
ncbi:Hypothetical protein NTJ_11691 [Nesidiocoris tenuis]|uniref:IGFBP N-terminal domain-containing protein n=1 Tax=Nesidiocoris tenuis TaxID=355587 RepID=A0ABN7B387_9HEMI|nr:Hypothetical protein NTJ_11691 [Nesidiocoris tenuis]